MNQFTKLDWTIWNSSQLKPAQIEKLLQMGLAVNPTQNEPLSCILSYDAGFCQLIGLNKLIETKCTTESGYWN